MFFFELLEDGHLAAGINMQKDKELFKSIGADTVLLRFYKWENFSITYGLSARAKKDLNVSLCQKDNVDVSVRPTGGGIVFHGDRIDFTYSLIVGRNVVDKFLSDDLTENYRIIHSVIAAALNNMNIAASLSDKKADHNMPESCFLRFALNDILSSGKKLAGAAQRLGKNGFLHQGYLSLNYADCEKYLKNISAGDFERYTYPLLDILNSDDKLNVLKQNIISEIKNYFEC